MSSTRCTRMPPFDFGIVMLNLSREMARAFNKVTTHLIDASVGHPLA